MIRLYLDQDSMAREVVHGLRAAGVDVLTTSEAGNLDSADRQQLAFAVSQGRTLYTANVGDFARLHAEYLKTGKAHFGILANPRQHLLPETQLAALLRFCRDVDEPRLASTLLVLTRWM